MRAVQPAIRLQPDGFAGAEKLQVAAGVLLETRLGRDRVWPPLEGRICVCRARLVSRYL